MDIQHAPDGSRRLFVVEKAGYNRVFNNTPTVSQSAVFLGIHNRVNSNGYEQGLLGLAFHPDYQNNGYFFVNYTASNPRRTIVSRFSVFPANPASEIEILRVNQPFSNHNGGGKLHFARTVCFTSSWATAVPVAARKIILLN